MAHVIQLGLGAFISSLGVKDHTKFWEAHEHNQQFGENESIDIGKCQRLRKEGNARINEVAAMRPGLAKIIENVCISIYFESPETDLYIAENDCCIVYADTWLSKQVHWLSKSQVHIVLLLIVDVKTRWNSTRELHERAYQLREFTREWLKNPEYNDYQQLILTWDEWTIIKYVMEVLRPLLYWTLWMSKMHIVTVHHVITVYHVMLDHMDGVMRALAETMTQWKADLYFAVKFARPKLSKNHSQGNPTTWMLLISAHIFDPFRKLQSFRKWDKGMDISREDETSYTTQYQEEVLKDVEKEYCTKRRPLPVTKPESIPYNNLFSPTMASRSG